MSILGKRINPDAVEVVKLFPRNPPERGQRVLVNGVPHRVTSCRVRWREPGMWWIKSLRVKPIREQP